MKRVAARACIGVVVAFGILILEMAAAFLMFEQADPSAAVIVFSWACLTVAAIVYGAGSLRRPGPFWTLIAVQFGLLITDYVLSIMAAQTSGIEIGRGVIPLTLLVATIVVYLRRPAEVEGAVK